MVLTTHLQGAAPIGLRKKGRLKSAWSVCERRKISSVTRPSFSEEMLPSGVTISVIWPIVTVLCD